MVRSLLVLGAAALALVGDASATKFILDETYDSTNFFDKWNFFESNYDSPDYNDVDPTSGYVNYRSQHDAKKIGLIKDLGDEVRIGVNSADHGEFPGIGRDSVRLESKSIYNHGLMIARFSHLPKPVCGSWPAFWSFGDPWPTVGELDFYEGWNDQKTNTPVVHTNHALANGTCEISQEDQTSEVVHANCDTYAGVWEHQGCTSKAQHADPWGSEDGGIYAVEWTEDAIKFYSWTWENAPDNIDSEEPDTSTWGKPSLLLANDSCNVNNHFKNHKLVINITFCGKAAGNPGIWGESCRASTGEEFCSDYVANNPEAFEDTYWQIKDIRHFGLASPAAASSSAIAASSSAPTHLPPSSSGFHYANSSATTAPAATITSSDSAPVTSLATSTVYTTRVSTVTACPPYIPDCPDRIGQVVTEVIAVTTTVCPVVISTKTVKQIHSVTACPPSVPSSECPYGSKTTETFLTTVTKTLDSPPKATSPPYGGSDEGDEGYEGGKDYGSKDDGSKDDGSKDYGSEGYPGGGDDEHHGGYTPGSDDDIVPIPPAIPYPPVSKPISKNITVPAHDTDTEAPKPEPPVYDDDYDIPETSGAAHTGLAAGLTIVMAAAAAFLAM